MEFLTGMRGNFCITQGCHCTDEAFQIQVIRRRMAYRRLMVPTATSDPQGYPPPCTPGGDGQCGRSTATRSKTTGDPCQDRKACKCFHHRVCFAKIQALPQEPFVNVPGLTEPSYVANDWAPIRKAGEIFDSDLGGLRCFDQWVTRAMIINPNEAYRTHNTVPNVRRYGLNK